MEIVKILLAFSYSGDVERDKQKHTEYLSESDAEMTESMTTFLRQHVTTSGLKINRYLTILLSAQYAGTIDTRIQNEAYITKIIAFAFAMDSGLKEAAGVKRSVEQENALVRLQDLAIAANDVTAPSKVTEKIFVAGRRGTAFFQHREAVERIVTIYDEKKAKNHGETPKK